MGLWADQERLRGHCEVESGWLASWSSNRSSYKTLAWVAQGAGA